MKAVTFQGVKDDRPGRRVWYAIQVSARRLLCPQHHPQDGPGCGDRVRGREGSKALSPAHYPGGTSPGDLCPAHR